VDGYVSAMRRFGLKLTLACAVCFAFAALGTTGRIIKVLPEFLDLKGHNSLSPSLYERDVYQAMLRDHPERRSALRFYIQWKTKGPVWQPLTVKVEMRGNAEGNLPKQLVLEEPVENPGGSFSHWTRVTLNREDYKKIGSVTAWRVTFWEGKTLLAQQQSYLW
jgi:hypothetical protein